MKTFMASASAPQMCPSPLALYIKNVSPGLGETLYS